MMRNTQSQDVEHPMNLEADANARLIAAAPDLLEAAIESIDCIEREGLDKCNYLAFENLRAAIHKAEEKS